MKEYREIIREWREDRDLSQTEVAKILNIGQTTYSQYERGTREIPLEILLEILTIYNLDIYDVLKMEHKKRKYKKQREELEKIIREKKK